jgi:hypothetical protein
VASISVVAELAAYVDELLAEHWEDLELTLAIARGAPGEQLEVVVVSVDGQPTRSVAAIPAPPCSAACLSAVGTATRLGSCRAEPVAVRMTAVVGCCDAVVLMRHADGRVHQADEASGPLIELLRWWVNLIPCPTCATRSVRPQRLLTAETDGRFDTRPPHSSRPSSAADLA